MQNEDAQVRVSAAEVLGQIGSGAVDAMPALIQVLRDQNPEVRQYAVGALGHIAAVDAVPALMQALKDQNPKVRNNAAWALEQIGTPEALKAVKEYQSRQ